MSPSPSRPGGVLRLVLVALLLVAAGLLVAPAGGAAAARSAGSAWQPAQVADLARQLGVTRTEAAGRLAAQPSQAALADRLTRSLGRHAAGSFVDRASGALVVNVLDRVSAARVQAAGARARLVGRSLARLDRITAALDRAGGVPGTAWGVDVTTNKVVVSVPAGASGARTAALLARARSYGSAVRVERVGGAIRSASTA